VQKEAVTADAKNEVKSDDLAGVVDPVGLGRERVGCVEGGVAAIHAKQEAMLPASSVLVPSHDLAGVVDPIGTALARGGRVNRGIAAIHIQQEAVLAGCVKVISYDLSEVIDP